MYKIKCSIKMLKRGPFAFRYNSTLSFREITPDSHCRLSELVPKLHVVVASGRLDKVGRRQGLSQAAAVLHKEQGLPAQGNQHSQGVLQGVEPDHHIQDRDFLVVHLERELQEHLREVGHPEVPDLDPIGQVAGPDPVDPVVDTDPVLGRAGDAEQDPRLGQRDRVLLEPRSQEEMVTDQHGQKC